MPESNPVTSLASFNYDVVKELQITLHDQLLVIKDGRTPIVALYRATSPTDAWQRAEQLASKNVGALLRKYTTLPYTTLWVDPVGRIGKMTREDPGSAILVTGVPNEQPFILIHALAPDVDIDALSEFRFA